MLGELVFTDPEGWPVAIPIISLQARRELLKQGTPAGHQLVGPRQDRRVRVIAGPQVQEVAHEDPGGLGLLSVPPVVWEDPISVLLMPVPNRPSLVRAEPGHWRLRQKPRDIKSPGHSTRLRALLAQRQAGLLHLLQGLVLEVVPKVSPAEIQLHCVLRLNGQAQQPLQDPGAHAHGTGKDPGPGLLQQRLGADCLDRALIVP